MIVYKYRPPGNIEYGILVEILTEMRLWFSKSWNSHIKSTSGWLYYILFVYVYIYIISIIHIYILKSMYTTVGGSFERVPGSWWPWKSWTTSPSRAFAFVVDNICQYVCIFRSEKSMYRYTHTHIYIYTCKMCKIYMCIYIYILYIYIYMYIYMYIYIYVCVYVYVYMYM